MNHLEEAKKNMKAFDMNSHNSIDTMKAHAIAHALIAIAEQLEKLYNMGLYYGDAAGVWKVSATKKEDK